MSSRDDPAMSLPERAQALLDAWFGPAGDPDREQHREIWFKGTAEFDAALRDAFLADYEAGAAGELRSWEALPEGALALVLLLDQIPRNIFRGTPRAYADRRGGLLRCRPGARTGVSTGSFRRSGGCSSTCRFTTARISPTNAARSLCSTRCRAIPTAAVPCVVTGGRISRSSSGSDAFRTAIKSSAANRPRTRSPFLRSWTNVLRRHRQEGGAHHDRSVTMSMPVWDGGEAAPAAASSAWLPATANAGS